MMEIRAATFAMTPRAASRPTQVAADPRREQADPLHRQFSDPVALMDVRECLGFEGIVSKRKDSVYRSGPRCGWIKTKCQGWRAANKDRGKFFERV